MPNCPGCGNRLVTEHETGKPICINCGWEKPEGVPAVPKPPSLSKMRNKPTTYKGMRFDSKLEAQFCKKLEALKARGMIRYYLRQVRFDLPGKTTYRCDFMLVWHTGAIDYVDVKGQETKMFRMKKKQVEDLYPVIISVVKKGDF